MESISEQVADLEHALRLEREANEQLREAIIGRGLDPDTIEADLDAVDRRLLELSGGRVALDPSPATGYAAPTPIEPCDDWERRRAAWHPGGYPNPEHPFPDDDLPRKRSALREIILEQRVELEAFRERCDAYSNELEGWRSEAQREAHDCDVDRAVADSHLEHAKHLDERCRDLEEVAEARGSALAAAESLLKRQADEVERANRSVAAWARSNHILAERAAELEPERDALQRDLDRYGPLLADANERITELEAELREWRTGGLTVEGLPIDPDMTLIRTTELANLGIDRDGWRSRAQALQARVDEIELEIAAGLEATELRRERDEANACLEDVRAADRELRTMELERGPWSPSLAVVLRKIRVAVHS